MNVTVWNFLILLLLIELQHNSRVESLDLTDNDMSEEAQLHVVEVLRHNNSISSLVSINLKIHIVDSASQSELWEHTLYLVKE